MIRVAEKKDKEAIFRLGAKFACETIAIADKDYFDRMFEKCMKDGVVLVGEENGTVVGFLGGCFEYALLLGGLMFREVAWYVDPEHRGCGKQLFDEMERIVKESGAKMIFMIAYGNDSQRAVELLYARRGYKDIEHHWMKRLV